MTLTEVPVLESVAKKKPISAFSKGNQGSAAEPFCKSVGRKLKEKQLTSPWLLMNTG